MSVKLNKSDVYARLNFNSVEDMNIAMMEVGEYLTRQEKEVPEEFANPEKFADISKEHLTLLRDSMRKALEEPQQEPPALPSGDEPQTQADENKNGNGALTEGQPQTLGTTQSFHSERLAGLQDTLVQLGFKLGDPTGILLSDAKWDAIEKAYLKRDEENLEAFVLAHKDSFVGVLDQLQKLANERTETRGTHLGKLNVIANFSDLNEKIASIQKR